MDRLQTLTRCVRAPQILAAPETEDTGAQFEAPTTGEKETQCPVLSSGATSTTAGLLPSCGIEGGSGVLGNVLRCRGCFGCEVLYRKA